MDVLRAAWIAAGEPGVPAATTTIAEGRCARCLKQAKTRVKTRSAVSKVFTAFDEWGDPGGDGLCTSCTWGYRTPALRTDIHLVSRTHTLTRLSGPDLLDLLAAPLPPDTAVVVPLRPGRKHLIQHALWGRVCLDDITLHWSTTDVDRLQTLLLLRHLGFTAEECRRPAPPFPRLTRIPRGDWAEISELWGTLEPWRSRRPWMDLALLATRTTTAAAA